MTFLIKEKWLITTGKGSLVPTAVLRVGEVGEKVHSLTCKSTCKH